MKAAMDHAADVQRRIIHGDPALASAALLTGGALLTSVLAPVLLGLGRSMAGLSGATAGFTLAGICVSCLLCLLLHESGHALGAWASGFRVTELHLGPFRFRRTVDGWRWSPASRLGIAVIASPRSPRDVRSGLAFALAAGPVVCAASGLAFVAGVCSAAWLNWAQAAEACALMAAASFSMALISFAPVDLVRFRTSGAALRGLALNDTLSWHMGALGATGVSLSTDLRPRDWPDDIVRRLTILEDGSSEQITGRYLAYLHHLDKGDIDGAHRHLAEMVDEFFGVSPRFPALYALEIAYFQARYRGRPASARRWLREVAGAGYVPKIVLTRVRAAVFAAEGNLAAAHACAAQLVLQLDGSGSDGFTAMERVLAEDLYDLSRPELEETAPPARAQVSSDSTSLEAYAAP